MIYIKRKVYKDKLIDIDLFFIKKATHIDSERSYWQPVKKIAPFVYIKHKSPFIDYTGNFELV